MKVFVTGGSGFVGGHAIEGLRAAKHDVRALARSDAAASAVTKLGAEPVHGDLADVGAAMLRGADVVLHSAALTKDWGTREEFWAANVDATKRLLEATREAGVPRFVFVGTEAALFTGADLVDVDESTPYPARHEYLYSETKAEAEKLVLAANGGGLTTLSIRPRLVWGPRDTTVLPVVLAMAKAGRFRWLGGGVARTSTTHVANLVHALVLALDHGEGGRAYFVADEGTRTIREFLSAYAKAKGVELGDASLPKWLARASGVVVEGWWRTFGLRSAPPVTRFAVDMMSATVTVRTTRAKQELGWAPVIDVERGLREL